MLKQVKAVQSTDTPKQSTIPPRRPEIPLNCSAGNLTRTCPASFPTSFDDNKNATSSSSECPEYFRWIHEDLKPWKDKGITREMVEKARKTAKFRLVIVNGKVYVKKYSDAIQTRDEITLWGILQLLRRYPGRLPDLDLMFDCDDRPLVQERYYRGPNATSPPPLFRYCGDHWTLDIVFPDWSFWGWHEINIKPWETILKELKEGNERTKWIDREPYAYWKGNPFVAPTRQDLLNCNVSEKQDWNARLYIQDWIGESQKGYKQSSLADQCTHRYKIYIEGWAWSVSEKYILACDSLTLMVRPRFYTFFSRGMLPMRHYWPIKDGDKCRSLKFAVEWSNNHTEEAEAIGKAASNFIQDEMKMEYVYDYMFHLLNEYAKLLRYRPTVPEDAMELCSETLACPATGREKTFMMESMVKFPAETSPCTMTPPFDSQELQAYYKGKYGSINQVQRWEKRYWESQNKQI
ncbi:O-glucosyltransferase rumi homolog [Telopea speciosissima]|uniref:O-glucosyltransferase rumi homolog n=1 Tax=Telopea speciosissima TaxID=54955 RepID=UPI001CC7F183|nr:O-glucosyltransferase rumi homolog [Telopea speciosissima]